MENHFTPSSVNAHPSLRLYALIKAGWEEHLAKSIQGQCSASLHWRSWRWRGESCPRRATAHLPLVLTREMLLRTKTPCQGAGYSCYTFPNHLLQKVTSRPKASPKTQPGNLCWRLFALLKTLHLHRAESRRFITINSYHRKGFTFNYTILRLYIVFWPLDVIKYRCSQSLMSV